MNFLFELVVIIFSIVLHEIAHGAVANAMGDSTAKDLGRLTLNPTKHLDLFGSIILPVITKLATGFIFGYAKPVPYNPNNLSDKRFGPAKVAFAGPAVNITLAVLFGLVIRILPMGLQSPVLLQLLSYVVWINLTLAIFNLMPIPPLDGHWLLFTFLPIKFAAFRLFLARYGLVIFIVFLFFIFPLIYSYLIYPLFKVIIGISAS